MKVKVVLEVESNDGGGGEDNRTETAGEAIGPSIKTIKQPTPMCMEQRNSVESIIC